MITPEVNHLAPSEGNIMLRQYHKAQYQAKNPERQSQEPVPSPENAVWEKERLERHAHDQSV